MKNMYGVQTIRIRDDCTAKQKTSGAKQTRFVLDPEAHDKPKAYEVW